jgi:hypothetical protein
MSVMFEVYCRAPADAEKEAMITERVRALGGHLDYREESNGKGRDSVVLTFDFDDGNLAAKAAEDIRKQGEHVEGPYTYGE